ncbi:hypothetical protein D3C75_948930 [compost metagenome]
MLGLEQMQRIPVRLNSTVLHPEIRDGGAHQTFGNFGCCVQAVFLRSGKRGRGSCAIRQPACSPRLSQPGIHAEAFRQLFGAEGEHTLHIPFGNKRCLRRMRKSRIPLLFVAAEEPFLSRQTGTSHTACRKQLRQQLIHRRVRHSRRP